jgi:hypothetical protein
MTRPQLTVPQMVHVWSPTAGCARAGVCIGEESNSSTLCLIYYCHDLRAQSRYSPVQGQVWHGLCAGPVSPPMHKHSKYQPSPYLLTTSIANIGRGGTTTTPSSPTPYRPHCSWHQAHPVPSSPSPSRGLRSKRDTCPCPSSQGFLVLSCTN